MYNKKTFKKIYLKIDSIAKKGIIGHDEYNIYLNEIIDSNQFHIFRDVLDLKYKIPKSHQLSIQYIKENTFDMIRLQTTSIFQENLNKYYKSLSIYQMGMNICMENTSYNLGSITSITSLYNTSATGLTSSLLNSISTITALNVLRSDNIFLSIDDPLISLLDKYKKAVQFLMDRSHIISYNFLDGSGNIYGWTNSSLACTSGPSGHTMSVYTDKIDFMNGDTLYSDIYNRSLNIVSYYPYQYYYYPGEMKSFLVNAGNTVSNISSC